MPASFFRALEGLLIFREIFVPGIFFWSSIKRNAASAEWSGGAAGTEREAIATQRCSNAHAHKGESLVSLAPERVMEKAFSSALF